MELQHKTGGDGWAFIQELGDDMGRVIGFSKTSLGGQAFLVWKKLLTVAPPKPSDPRNPDSEKVPSVLPDGILQDLKELRSGLASGKLEVRNTRIVEV